MSVIKDDRTAQLDVLTSAAEEMLELYRDLLAKLEDDGLQAELAGYVEEQSALLERLEASRRERGELPQAGDPERAHLRALAVRLRTFAMPEDGRASILEALADAAAHVRAEAEAALAMPLPAQQSRLLADYKRSCNTLEDALRARLS